MSELIDNRQHRIGIMKDIICHLHSGGDREDAKQRLRELVRETDAQEIAAMEQQLMAEGMAVAEVQSMCDTHSEVLREIMVERPTPLVIAGHPVDTLRCENEALATTVARMRAVIERIEALDDAATPTTEIRELRAALNELLDVEKHYQRKEQLLFSCLERHEITGPSKVMWGKDDEVRALLKASDEALSAGEATTTEWRLVMETVIEPALAAVEEMIFKEEHILLPMALGTLTDDEWGEVWRQSPEYGWCIVEPRQGYQPPPVADAPRGATVARDEAIRFPTGALRVDQLAGVLRALPMDLTFVDADDTVRYFSEGPDRVFARSQAILGRKVQHCHPPSSVATVEQILADFRAGRQEVAEFWITFQGRFVNIRYFAVRDEAGAYAGTLEVTQDLTRLRALEGERRLLQYEDAGPSGS